MEKEKKERPARFSLLALVLGITALASSVGYFWLGPISPSPSMESALADKAVEIRDSVVAKLKGEETPQKPVVREFDADRIAMASISGLAALTLILAVIGFVRHESLRMAVGATVLGGTALALQYVIIAIGAIVCAIILGAILNGLDFSP